MANFDDEINQMIIDLITGTTYTSASPGHTNIVKLVGTTLNPGLEDMIRKMISEEMFANDAPLGIKENLNTEEEIQKLIDDKLKESTTNNEDLTNEEKLEKQLDDTLKESTTDDEDLNIEEEIQKQLDSKLKESITKKDPKNTDEFNKAFTDEMGGLSSKENLLKFGKNPKAVAQGILKTLPFIGGIVAVADFAAALIAEVERTDRFFKIFIPDVETLHNQLRKREESAFIAVGNQQLILSVRAGQTSPRLSYNTFNVFNRNRKELESDFAIRENSGL